MWNRIRHLFSPPVFEDDEEKTRAARLINSVIWLNLIVWGLALISLPLLPQGRLGFSIILSLLIIGFGGIIALRAGRVKLVASTFISFLWMTVSVLVAISGGIINPQTMGFMVVIMVAGLLSGTRTAIIFSGLCIFSALSIFFLEINELRSNLLPMTSETGLLIVIINITLASSLLAVALNNLKRVSQRVQQYTQVLEQERATLEERVDERALSAEIAQREAETAKVALETRLWHTREQARFNETMRGEQDIFTLANSCDQHFMSFARCFRRCHIPAPGRILRADRQPCLYPAEIIGSAFQTR